ELHYVVPYGQEWEVIELEQLKSRYYEPGLLPKLLGYANERMRPVEAFQTVELYPKVEANIEKDELQVQLHARNGGIGRLSIFINGKEVVEEINPLPRLANSKRDSIIKYDLAQHRNYLLQHPDSINVISLRAYNEGGWLKSRSIDLTYRPGPSSKGQLNSANTSPEWIGRSRPKLYMVAIGTSEYTGDQLDLAYADQDAKMMATAMQSIGTALFQNGDSLEVYCFSTDQAQPSNFKDTHIHWQFASKTNIQNTFSKIKHKAKAEDIIMVYLSGHGVSKGGTEETQFYYLTQGVSSEDDLNDPATLNAFTISSREMTKWINDIPALKQVLVIDACNSGQVIENLTGGSKRLNSSQIRALDRMKDRTGMFILAGSASDKLSYEASEYGQGLLTYALLQGMLGVATRKDDRGKDIVDVMKLFQYARDQVPELAATINGIQTPMLGFPGQGASFDIGILDESAKAKIPIGNKKPVMIRSTFLNKATFKDDLHLSDKLEAAFRKTSAQGADATLIYVDVNAYPNAYSLAGIYDTSGDSITIELRLFHGDDTPIVLQVPAAADAEELVDLILGEVEFEIY
ncbi:MAG: caspase family protein, partial [Saprospiraceae bacterium]|nr:caspase family protein [Saprospiraceae bacterium]